MLLGAGGGERREPQPPMLPQRIFPSGYEPLVIGLLQAHDLSSLQQSYDQRIVTWREYFHLKDLPKASHHDHGLVTGVGGLRGRPGTDRDAEWLILRTGEGTADHRARR